MRKFLLLIILGLGFSTIITVDASGENGDYYSIQDAIDNSGILYSTTHDTLFV